MIKRKTNWEERVSVQILTRQRHPYLATLLTSLRNQTFKNWDLIILDNNDAGMEIAHNHLIYSILDKIKYEKHKVILVKGVPEIQKNIGLSRNGIINIDKNPIGCRIDDDSILEPEYLQKLHDVLTGKVIPGFSWEGKIAAVGGVVPPYQGPKIMCYPPAIFNQIKKEEVPKKWLELGTRLNIDGFKEGEDYYNIGDPIDDGGMCYPTDTIVDSDHLRSSFMYWNDIIKEVGGHPSSDDTGFREETILSLKLRDKGYNLFTNTGAIAWHLWAPNLGRGTDPKEHQTKIFNNELRFQRDHRELLRRLVR